MYSFRIITLSIISFISCIEASPTDKLQTVYQWRYFDYVWPSESDKQNAIRNGVYNYSQIIPMDVDVAQDGRVFISLNYYFGTPARLAVITDQIEHSGPLLQPYPNWKWYDNDCDGIIDAVRIEIDNCNRLWIVDGGREEPGRVVCPSKILAFDLSTDTLVEEVILPYNISRNAKTNQTLLSNVRVETHGANCEKTTVYMTDASGYGLIVYDGKFLYRLESPTFKAVPGFANITSNSLNTNLSLGITGLDIFPKTSKDEQQYLYFRSSASLNLNAIKTSELEDYHSEQPIRILGIDNALDSQSLALIISKDGTMFFAPIQEHSVTCWNLYQKFDKRNFVTVAQDHTRLQFVTSLRVTTKSNPPKEQLWAISNRFQAFKYKILNFNEFNFHIMKADVENLIKGTKCDKPRKIENGPAASPQKKYDAYLSKYNSGFHG